jgi:hypothetical protein
MSLKLRAKKMNETPNKIAKMRSNLKRKPPGFPLVHVVDLGDFALTHP